MFKIEDGYDVELQTMKLFGSTKKLNRQNNECIKSPESWSGCSSFSTSAIAVLMQFSR